MLRLANLPRLRRFAHLNKAGTLTTMVYDKENRLKEHKQGAPGSETAFTYDLNSLKQSTTSGLVTDQLVWDGADMLGEVPAAQPVGAPLMPTRYNLAQGILFATTRFEPDPVRTDTGADFIGSILIDFDENGDYVAERRYKPYGELLAGTATTYGWTGNTGSRATLLQYAEQYNRRRHYSTKLKQWTTRDPFWPEESAYGYVRGGPLTWVDPQATQARYHRRARDIGFFGPNNPVHEEDDICRGSDFIPDDCYNSCYCEYLDDLKDCSEEFSKCYHKYWWNPYMRYYFCGSKSIVCKQKRLAEFNLCQICCENYQLHEACYWQYNCFGKEPTDSNNDGFRPKKPKAYFTDARL